MVTTEYILALGKLVLAFPERGESVVQDRGDYTRLYGAGTVEVENG
jgi:hypothetical protein